MDCAHFSENLFAFHEGTLSDGIRQALEDHLSSCASCKGLNAGFDDLTDIIKKVKATEFSPFTSTRILQRIESEFEWQESKNKLVWLRILQPVTITIALLAGILLGSYTAKTGKTSSDQMANKTNHIQFLKADLFISEFTDEDKILVLNK
jgi:hypothetical protein